MSKITRRALIKNTGLGLGTIAAASLIGCSRSDSSASNEAAAHTSQHTTPQKGGVIKIGVINGNQAGNLDAHKPIGMSSAFRGWPLYAKLWEWGRDIQPKLALAEFAEPNEDGTKWTIRLKKGLEFHHGKTITADDVIFSLRRLTDPKLASPFAAYLYSLQRDAIKKRDDYTVEIPFAQGKGLVALPEAWMSWGGIVPTDYDPIKNVVGAGPFKLESFTPGQRSRFVRFENYWKDNQPYADAIEIIDFKDQTGRLAALQSGQIDIASGISAEHLSLIQANKRLNVVSSETDAWQSFDMNTTKAPFNDPRVRQAFRLIVNRDDLVKRALAGQGRIANDLYSFSDPVYNHEIPQRKQDLAKAKTLLKAAGFDQNLKVDLYTGPDSNAALVFAQHAAQAGVIVNVKQVEAATFADAVKQDWALSTGSNVSRPFLLTVLQIDGPGAANNKTRFNQARFTELVHHALQQPDLEKRKVLVHEAQQIQHEQGGLLIWGFNNVLDAHSHQIGGVTPDRTGFAAWRTDEFWRKGE
ncbi:ABC transporter substrate-binding protein [Acinetobacter guillouiae]|uniref:ABC transporter substrate-binding protein n=1 Tax=Acinetobacter guillouiae TaxID=106649 RepID=UPI003C6FE30C